MDSARLEVDSFVSLILSHDGVAVMELDRGQKRNALSQALINDLVATIASIEKDDRVRCAVLISKEGPFSAGADLAELVHLSTCEAHSIEYLKSLNDAVSLMRKPIIAAVTGFALGGGFELAMMCDIIYAADDAEFGLPELTVGTIPGAGGTQRLIRLLGKHKVAMDLILTSSTISAVELYRLGGISRIFPVEEVRAAAIASAVQIASKSAPVVKLAKQSILNAEQTDLENGMKLERGLYYASFSLQDKMEGMSAFLERRKAVFKHC